MVEEHSACFTSSQQNTQRMRMPYFDLLTPPLSTITTLEQTNQASPLQGAKKPDISPLRCPSADDYIQYSEHQPVKLSMVQM